MLSEPQSQCEAIQRREERLDDSFLTAAKTTGTYCRPSCRAKTRRTGNVDFQDSGQRAAHWIPSRQALLARRGALGPGAINGSARRTAARGTI
ncbi:Ada metal-binding domain-containing protein [Micromonospora sp. ZYX-F-536]|uniref:Ada metal-binding domain-containing protein n=1 Tax=Micromonospora sp. ZYX-F-536 TaxID=3457629 RepID=UPI004040C91C